ncbi:MAG TPA: PadR family transcriptional regulator [Vicinamibacteria bacterium]|nr:PadR family transcriptional regulator [Vicinamibacteria bacterium]
MTSPAKSDVPPGTLELLILKTLSFAPMHGLGVSKRLEQMTRGVFRVNPGSFFPALHRMEQEGFLEGEWGRSENNRQAKFYRLTQAGRRRLKEQERDWRQTVSVIARVLEAR